MVPVLSHALLSDMGSCHNRSSWLRHWALCNGLDLQDTGANSKEYGKFTAVCHGFTSQSLSRVSFIKHLLSKVKDFVKISLISLWKSEDLRTLESCSTWEFKYQVRSSSYGVTSRCKMDFFFSNFPGILKFYVLGSILEDMHLLRKKLENFSWLFLNSQVEAVIGGRCWALFPIQTTK